MAARPLVRGRTKGLFFAQGKANKKGRNHENGFSLFML
jgi:hypothetical protein